jgi:AmmeMemoRadiSam system protein B
MLRSPEIRAPVVAGTFYPSGTSQLRRTVDDMLANVEAEPESAVAVIVPHAGLVYSGQCAAHVWKRVTIPETVVILAPNHTGLSSNPGGASAWNHGAFRTPFGEVPIAEEFLAVLEKQCTLVGHDPAAHAREHAIEVQLPFLQTLAPSAALAPIVVGWDRWDLSLTLATALAESIAAYPDDVLLVSSSDMTHYESAASAERKDRAALDTIEQLDGERLLDVCHKENVTMCGRAPSAIVLETARQLGATKAAVVDYRHSGWVTGDDSSVVAYAGVVVN